jgi:cytochrome-b5 reductase
LTQHTPQGKWIPCLRPYSPTHDRSKPGVLELVVKKYEGGLASTHLHSLDVGETLDFRGPLPGYEWKSSNSGGEVREVVLIAGGAGITPLYSLVRGVLADDPSARLHLIWGVNGSRDIIFKRELETLQTRHPGRLQITYAVSGSPDQLELELEAGSSTFSTTTQGGVTATYRSGHVSKRLIQSVVESIDPAVFGDVKGTKVFFCGPPRMEEAITGKKTGTLAQLGIEGKALYKF